MLDKKKIKFAVEIGKCPISDVCVLSSTKTCTNKLGNCQLPLILNPLCLCKDYRNCHGNFYLRTFKGKTYILYNCGNCQYRIKYYTKFLNRLRDKNLIVGEDLSALLDEIEKSKGKDKKGRENSSDLLIKFLDYHLRHISSDEDEELIEEEELEL